MKKYLVPVLLILLIVLNFGRLVSTQASLNSTSKMKFSVTAATLDFKLNGDKNDSLKIDLGEVKPGDSGTVEIKVNNIGDISGSLCIKGQNTSELKVQSIDTCGVNVVPNDSIQFEINWSLPIEAHNTGVNGTDFQFSYTFTFVNGFKVTKNVILKGTMIDPTDDPTPTPTDTATTVVTETATETSVPVVITTTPTVTETVIETVTDTPVPTEVILTDTEVPPAATEIVTDTQVPIEVIPTDIPIEVPTDVVPTEVQ